VSKRYFPLDYVDGRAESIFTRRNDEPRESFIKTYTNNLSREPFERRMYTEMSRTHIARVSTHLCLNFELIFAEFRNLMETHHP